MRHINSNFVFLMRILWLLLFLNLLASKAKAVTWEGVPAGYGLTWSDEFNGAIGSQANPSNWSYETGPNGANAGTGEIEYNTADFANSHIVADPQATDGLAMAIIMNDTTPGSGNYSSNTRYTSAKFQSVGLQQYGQPINTFYVARIHLAGGYGGGTADGIGEAWWMLGSNFPSVGWPACGEVDILENGFSNSDESNMHSTLHFPNGPGQAGTFMGLLGPAPHDYLSQDYHTYSALIQNNQVQFFLDGNLFETLTPSTIGGGTWVFNVPDFMILSMGTGGGDPDPDASTSFPATMLVDYARVYQQGQPTPVPVSSYTWNVACGDDTYVDGNGVTWIADTNFTGGWPSYTSNTIANQTNQQQLYQFGREGNPTGGVTLTYTFNVPPDAYQVNLGFSENSKTGTGQRVFNAIINGNAVLSNFDIYQDSGGENKTDIKTFSNIVPDTNGQIVIQLVPGSADYPTINSIQILPVTGVGSPTVTPTNTFTPTFTPTPVTQSVWRIDAGGDAVTDSSGNVWSGDEYFAGGMPVSNTGANITNEHADGLQSLYQTDREADPYVNNFSYTFNVPPGTYQVSLLFAEITSGVTAGKRVFNIGINGSTVSNNFDIYSAAGNRANYGVTEVYNGINPDVNGQITISFTGSGGSYPPEVAGIQILSLSPTATFTNTPTVTPTNTATSTMTATLTNTSTSTVTNTFTQTVTNTMTNTSTNTATSTAANTFIQTATNTVTNTPTNTNTNTPTNTLTSTLTNSPTNTVNNQITNTPTDTLTATLTATGVPLEPMIYTPYPNPSKGSPISFNVVVPSESTVTMDVFTLALRKIVSHTTEGSGLIAFQWDLRDITGNQTADGLYYVRIHVNGIQSVTKILKVLVLR